jgi:hypothetical protein
MEHYNANASMLPNAGGSIEPMRGGGVPDGFNPDASVIQLPPSANSIPIVDMKGGDETMPMAAAATATVTSAPLTPAKAVADPLTKTAVDASGATPEKAIRFILFDIEFKDFSTEENASSKPILDLLGTITGNKKDALQQIYNGIVNLRKDTNVLGTYPHLKRLLIRMGINYAKEKKELTEDPNDLEKTDIKLAFSADKVTVTLTIPCDQQPSCHQKDLPMAAAATAMLQKGGADDPSRDIQLFGETYTFSKRPENPKDITNDHKKLLTELKANESTDATFQIELLQEIYDGCYTDGPIISRRDCSTFGTLLETLGEKYAETMHDMLSRSIRSQKKGESSVKKDVLENGDIRLTFTFSKFGKQEDAEIPKKENATSPTVASSDQVSIHGMENQKNACFCISAIQLLFSIPQIRTIVKDYKCDPKVLEEIRKPDHTFTEVENDGIMCALFTLFEALGKDIKTFSTVTSGDLSSKNAVPYALLGYIMKNFEVDRKGTDNAYTVGRQEDADAFLTFLFGKFKENKIPIEHLFEFTINSTHGTPKDSDAMFWPLGLARDTSGIILLTKGIPKQVFSIEGLTSVKVGTNDKKTTEIKKDTIILKKNPYVLIKTSVNQIGDVVTDASGSMSQPRYNNIDLTAITPELTIDGTKFKLFGSIQYNGHSVPVNSKDSAKGTDMRGHYIYTRRDLASKKGIIYNDSTLILDDDIGKGSNQFPHYLLVYAEVGSAEAPVKKEAEKVEEEAEDVKPASEDDLRSIEKQPKPESKSESSASSALTELLSNKIEERLKAAQTVKNKTVDSDDMIRIKKAFSIPDLEADKNKIMNAILGNIDLWMATIPKDTKDHATAYLNYITFLVLKSKIDAQLNRTDAKYEGKEISHTSSKKIAQELIDHYEKIPETDRLSIERMAEHIIEHQYFDQLQAAKELKAGGRRTLRAKKHILRVSKQSPKKRTLRAAKKLRQLLNST